MENRDIVTIIVDNKRYKYNHRDIAIAFHEALPMDEANVTILMGLYEGKTIVTDHDT